MLYMVNPSTQAIGEAIASRKLGAMMTPAQGNRLPASGWYAVDNGCGPGKDGKPGKGYPGDGKYLRFLAELADADGTDPCDPDRARCLFAAAPDVVGDAAATLRRSERMLAMIRYYTPFPVALVAQNGLEDMDVPWGAFDALFIGGDDAWKLGPAVRMLVRQAKDLGLHVHMGRVNSLARLLYAAAIGCDSADGTHLTYAPDRGLPEVLGWAEAADRQDVIRSVLEQAGLWDDKGQAAPPSSGWARGRVGSPGRRRPVARLRGPVAAGQAGLWDGSPSCCPAAQ